MPADTDLLPRRRARIESLLHHWQDWIPMPHQRLASADGTEAGQSDLEKASEDADQRNRLARMRGHKCPRCPRPADEAGRLCKKCWKELSQDNARELARLELQARVRAGEADKDELTRILDAKAAQYANGSYHDLEQAMRHLRRRQPYTFMVLQRVYVDGMKEWANRDRVDAALRALSDLLPDVLFAPTGAVSAEETRETRDAKIRQLAGQGLTSRAIASRVGVSHVTVSKVLKLQSPGTEAA